MTDTTYAVRKYYHLTGKEFLALIVTAFFAGFIFTFDITTELNELITGWLSLAALLLFVFFIVILLCKLIAIRIGYTIQYEYHLAGLLFGVLLTIFSAGFLPFFLPGGFVFERPERLRIGKFIGHFKGWEMGLIAAAFPLLLCFSVLAISPLYMWSGDQIYLSLLVAVLLTATFSLLPLPMLKTGHKGNVRDWANYLHGSTFGLEVYFSSRGWYVVLAISVLSFTFITYLTALVGGTMSFFLYALVVFLGIVGVWVYSRFFHRS